MSDNYLLYDPAAFGALEIKEDTREAEILRLRAENEKLRAALDGILADTTRTTMPPLMNVRMISVGVLDAAAAALKEDDDG